jgi:hypothetical protein
MKWSRLLANGGVAIAGEISRKRTTTTLASFMAPKRALVAVLGVLLVGAAAGPAHAQTGPELGCKPPVISGEARDGSVLTGRSGGCVTPANLAIQLRWWRCNGAACVAVSPPRPSPVRYTLGPADVGQRMVLRQTAVLGLQVQTTESSTGTVEALAPTNLSPPEISGSLNPGETLVASLGFWSGTPPLRFDYTWQRCGRRCSDIPRAGQSRYLIRRADIGRRLRVVVTARNAAAHGVRAVSARTARVGSPTGLQRLRPFPTVVVAGQALADGARVSELSVRGPRGASVRVSCRGRSCPIKRLRRTLGSRPLRVRALERKLGAGTVVEIRVTEPGLVGKFTRIRIRRGLAPKRIDRCLQPGSSEPSACPL